MTKTCILRNLLGSAAIVFMVGLNPASAIEGGTSTYLLGTRDSFMGIVPGPGTYISLQYIHLNGGDLDDLSIAGQVFATPSIDVDLYQFSGTYVFDTQILGGTPAINYTQTYGDGTFSASGIAGGFSADVSDSDHGFADPTITPLIGWHDGNFHASLGLSIYIPAGLYDTAVVSFPPPDVNNAMNFGKNRWAFDPTLAMTWFDPQIGLELNAASGVTFTTRNEATDYQSAPEFHFETSVIQHFPSGWAVGAVGYAYSQIGEDSGSGADNLRAALGAKSLRSQTFGVGPFVSYTGKLGDVPVTLKAKYIHEFEARRRFEIESFFTSFSFSF